MKACPFPDVTAILSMSRYFYLRTQTTVLTLEDEITTAQTLTQHMHRCKQRQLNTHIMSHTHTTIRYMWDKNQSTNTGGPSAAPSFTMARWPFKPSTQTETEEMISGCSGWRGITRSALLIKWKSRKIVLGGTNNWVRAIEGHCRLQLLRLNTEHSAAQTFCPLFQHTNSSHYKKRPTCRFTKRKKP